MKKFRLWAILLSLAFVISSLVIVATATDEGETEHASYEHVVILGVDALGNFTLKADTPNMDEIFKGGATTDYALVENPSASAQGWGSLLIGTSCDVHGLTNYSIMEGAYSSDALPTVFKLLANQKPDAKMASFCSWNSINNGIIEEGIAGLTKKGVADAKISEAIEGYLAENGAPELLFCQFNNLDAIGHSTGYGTDEFLEGLTVIDGYIGDIYKTYEDAGIIDKTLFIVTGDHGGLGTTHGGWSPEEKYVFYGVTGAGVNNVTLHDMYIRDTAAIVCRALGIKGTEGWDSYVPEGLFANEEGILKRPPSAPELVYPSETPSADTDAYIGNYIDVDELSAGFFFDGDLSNFVVGSNVEIGRYVGDINEKATGTVYYPSGLYGSGVRVSYEGYLASENLSLDNKSFSIGLWVAPDPMTSAELVWSTKRWTDADGVGNFEQQGILIRNVYSNSNRYFGFNMGSGNYSVGGVEKTPTSTNYYYDAKNQYTPKEWVHTLMVVDRDAKKIDYYVNFELAKTIDLSSAAWFSDDYDIDPHGLFVLGQDITGVYPKSLEGSLDDLLIWNKAIDANTVESLKEYYQGALFDHDYAVDTSAEASSASSDEVTASAGATNTDNTPFTEFKANALGSVLTTSAKFEISGGFNLSDYDNAKYYIVDFDISTSSNYLPMNFVSVISGDRGSANIDASYNGITENGVLVGSLNGVNVTRTLSIAPYEWQHITLAYDLVGGEDGYPLYIYYNGDLIGNAEWISAAAKASGEAPALIECTRLLFEEFSTNGSYYKTTLIANAKSGIYVDDEYGNLVAFFSSGASMREANEIFDLVYGNGYALPVSDNIFSSNGVGYRTFGDALASGNGVIDLLHSDYYKTYTVTDPCTVRTNGYHFNYEVINSVKEKESEDDFGNKVYVFLAEAPLYTVTASDGSVKNYYLDAILKDVITAAPSGSTIKLFKNIEVGGDTEVYSKILYLDLNGYTVSNNDGYIRLYSGSTISVYGGNIEDSNAKEFIYLGNSSTGATANITNCTITADRTFAEVRSGTLNLTDCTYTQTGNNLRLANCASGGYAGDKTVVNIDGCTLDLGSALLVSAERASSYPAKVDLNITVNDSEIKTSSKLFHLKNTTEGAADSVTEIKVTGKSKLAFSTFDGGGATVPNTTVTFALGVMFSAEPTITGAEITLSDGGEEIGASGDSEYPYAVKKAEAAGYLYTVTSSDGAVTKYYEEMGLRALVGLAPTGSTITLYSDIDLSDTTETYVTKALVIDLNGHTITNTGERLRVQGTGNLTLKNGTLDDCGTYSGTTYKDKDFINIANGASSAVVVIDNCDIIGNGFFMDIKGGSVTVKNSTFKQGGKKSGAFINALAAGSSASISVESCEIDVGSASFIILNRASSYTDAVQATVSVKDSTISTSGSLFGLQNTTSGAASSSYAITVTGDSYLKFGSVDGGTATVSATTLSLGAGVKLSSMPTLTMGSILFVDGGDEITETDDANYPYEVSEAAGYLYTVTSSDGTVTKYYEEMGLRALVGLAPAGSTVTLYSDIDLSDTTETYVTKALVIDLNGHKITNTGERLRVDGAGNLTLKNGTLDDCGTYSGTTYKDKDFINIANGASSVVVVIDNCDIIGNGFFMDIKGGSVTVKNSTFKQGGKKSGAFINALAAGSSASISVESCEIDVGSASFITFNRASSYTGAVQATVSVKDSTISTSGSLFGLQNTTSGAASSSYAITVTGDSYLKFGSVDGGTATVSATALLLGKGVMLSSMPTLAAGSVGFTDGAKNIVETGDTEYPYEVISGELMYIVTKSDGTEIKVYKETSLQDLVALADSGSVIKLFANVTVTAEFTIASKNIELDLNGFTVTSNVRGRITGTTQLYIHGGTIEDGNADFIFISAGNDSVLFKIENCTVNTTGKLVDARSGSVEVVDSDFIGTAGSVFLLASQGTSVRFSATGSNFDLESASVVSTARGNYAEAALPEISIHNCTVSTSGSLFYLKNDYSADISKIRISITGSDTRLSYVSFDGGSCNVPDTVVTLGLGVKMNKIPTLALGSVELGEGAKGIVLTEDASYPYAVSDKTSISAKPYFSLTLYSDFTLNLCFRESEAHNIVKVTVGGVTIEPFTANGMVFYPIKDIAAYNAAETKEIEVDYLMEGIELSTVLEYSVVDYAKGLLASTFSTESKEMISRAIDYVKVAYEYAGEEVPSSVTDLLASDAYKAISAEENVTEIPESETSVGNLGAVIASAQLDLGSSLKFRFNIKAGVNASLTVKTVTVNETYEIVDGKCGEDRFIEVQMRAFDMYNGVITLSANGDVGSYDLKAYAHSGALALDETGILDELLLAMYNYCREANEYMKVQEKDFRSTASVVVKDGKAGTVTYVVDDGRADTAARLEPMLDDYENLKLTFALIANKYATLKTEYNEETGKYEYVFDENGKYVYTVNEETVAYWRELIKKYADKVEYSNHSFTHGFTGYNDEGGEVSYVDTSGNVRTVTLPVGSATAELYAAVQVFRDLFGVDVETLVMPGVAANRTDVVIDGVTYPGWFAYYLEIVEQMYADGILVGMRGDGFGEADMGKSFLVTPETFTSIDERLNIQSYTAKDINSFESWTQYIDYALESGGWANFCLHQIFEDGTVSDAFHLKISQARALFAYTNRDEVWVANYAEAAKYYAEWSTAEVTSVYDNGEIKVTLTDGENDELFNEALTVRVTVPTSWETCIVNGATELTVMTDASGEAYVLVDIVPDSGTVTLTAK